MWYVSEITPMPFHNRSVRLVNESSGEEMTLIAGEYTTDNDIKRRFPPIAEQQSKKRSKSK